MGGVFTAQNKVRPGAYINFKGVARPLTTLGTRGVVTLALAMSWGAEVTELFSTDLIDGKSLAKIGYSIFDAESQVVREALKNCYKAILYRLDTGGTKATASIAPLTITAKYAGIVGNSISVSVVANGAAFDVITFYRGVQVDKQTATTVAGLDSNAWVDFSGTGNLVANAGVTLATGTNGTISEATYTTYMNTIKAYQWNVMGLPQDSASVNAAVIAFIKSQRDTYGKMVQAVLYDVDEDYEGIISVAQGYATADETVSPTTFVAYVAGLTAGANVNQSNTYHVIPGATSIVYPIGVTPYGDDDIEAALLDGKFVLSTRQDGAIVVEQDINTLHTFTIDRPYAFSKNRVIRTLDEIANQVSLLFKTSFLGKVNNDAAGRTLFKGALISYISSLQAVGAIESFDSLTDIDVRAGEAIDAVVVDLAIKPVDSMEKLYMTVMVD